MARLTQAEAAWWDALPDTSTWAARRPDSVGMKNITAGQEAGMKATTKLCENCQTSYTQRTFNAHVCVAVGNVKAWTKERYAQGHRNGGGPAMTYHVYADDGYESAHRTLAAAIRAATRGAKVRRGVRYRVIPCTGGYTTASTPAVWSRVAHQRGQGLL